MEASWHLSVCICTYRRPQLLQRLLQALLVQDLPAHLWQIVVVDNDKEGSALAVLQQFQAKFGARLIALHEQRSNISLARNAAINASASPWLAMIDDDELPAPDWLSRLLACQSAYQADLVFAPVTPEYSPAIPAWIIRGGFFERRRLATGSVIGHQDARTGNVLIRRATLTAISATTVFDPAFGRTGGEDSMLFRKIAAYGAKMIWCDEAAVSEDVPPERASATWLLQRSYRTGQLYMRTELAMLHGGRRYVRALYLSARAILQAMLASLFAFCLALPKPLAAFHWCRIAASQIGKISYFFGRQQVAYGTD